MANNDNFKYFKGYIKALTECKNRQDAIDNVFYGCYGADMAYQRGYITYNDLEIIQKLIDLMKE